MWKALALFCLIGFALADLNVDISLSSDVYHNGDSIVVSWSVESDSILAERVLKWNTPLEREWNSNMFSVVNQNEISAIYQGRLVKRATPELTDFVTIHPQSAFAGELVLTEGYVFSQTGVYDISLNFVVQLLDGKRVVVTSNVVSLNVVTSSKVPTSRFRGSRAVDFKSCSSSQQSIVNTAIPNAITASAGASTYLNNSCTPAYITWFGPATNYNYNKITNDFQKINQRLTSRQFDIDCSCKQPGVYAFVYPTDPTHTIHLCPVFWDATPDPYSYNSQPGTLTHEMSHFNDVAGTQDYQYGVPGCYQLAKDDPSTACGNADSHEFFQESHPQC